MSQKHWQSNQWNISHVADASATNHELKAAPGTGMALYITDVIHIEGTTANVSNTLLDGSGGATICKTAPAASTSQNLHFQVPLRLSSNTALCQNVSGTSTNGYVIICGFTGRG